MPGTGDSPEGVPPFVQVERVGNDVCLWVKGKVATLSPNEAKALAAALTDALTTKPVAEEPADAPSA